MAKCVAELHLIAEKLALEQYSILLEYSDIFSIYGIWPSRESCTWPLSLVEESQSDDLPEIWVESPLCWYLNKLPSAFSMSTRQPSWCSKPWLSTIRKQRAVRMWIWMWKWAWADEVAQSDGSSARTVHISPAQIRFISNKGKCKIRLYDALGVFEHFIKERIWQIKIKTKTHGFNYSA